MNTISVTMLAWAKAMFGDVALDKRERAMRLFEENCELAQAADLLIEDCQRTMERTYSRPKDSVAKEAGGVLVTLLSFCAAWGVEPEQALRDEMRRIISKPSKHWRDKHDAKVEAGTTTGLSG